MATGTPTTNLSLNVWNGTDDVLRTEFNDNFSKIDTFAGTAVKNNTANTFTANQTAPAWIASGFTGAVAASRYVGATAGGAPSSGTFALGDFVIDQTGKVLICTSAGSPGTWTSAGITYTQGTGITISGTTISNAGVTQITAGTGISINQSTGNVTITGTAQFNPVVSPFV